MRRRFAMPLAILALVITVQLGAQQPHSRSWTPPRAADGHPDLEGVWNSASLTPLQRPPELGGKEFFTDDEAAAFTANRLQEVNRDRRDGPSEVDVNRSYNELFYDRGTKVARSHRTSLIVDPPNGRVPPMTPAARAKFDAAQAEFAAHGTDGPEARPLPDRCLMFSQSGPPMIPGNYNNNYQIVQTRDYVTILAEMGGQLRIIPLDGRPALPSSFSQWMGISRGHWDGATLVIETANFRFNDRSRFGVQYNGMTDENLRIIERFTRTAPDAITYRATIEDPTVYTKPWTFEVSLEKAGGPVYEYACHEGNYAMRDMLSGARALEKPPAPKSKPSAAVDPQSGFRLPLPHRDQLDDLGRRLYDQATRQDGRNIAGLRGPNGIRLYSPRVGAFQRELNEYLRFEAGISGPTRELAILVTARELSSQFEWAAHEPVALREGLSPATIDIVKNRSSVAGLPESEAAVIQLGREIFSDKRVTPETFARAVKLWGPTGVVNLVSLMGAYSSTAALLTAFDMQLPEGQKPLP